MIDRKTVDSDFLVIGSGVAGLFAALRLADHGSVIIVTKKEGAQSNTSWAQGGIASVLDPQDSYDDHVRDTLEAGAGLCDVQAVRMIVERGPALIRELMDLGVPFTRTEDGRLDLGREGGHHRQRIVHVKDMTGQYLENALLDAVSRNPNIQLLENHVAVDLITEHHVFTPTPARSHSLNCWGAYVLDSIGGKVRRFTAKATVLATGGCGQVYLHTTNPAIATGDGIAMAFRAGASIANMEFMQFHPTTLFHPHAKSFLISEAVRGEGAILRRRDGTAFMEKYHPLKDLAPRDIVARAIDNEMKTHGDDCVYLDITHEPADFVRSRFPNIYQTCLEFGLDMTKDWLPVVPAAHYLCGGVKVNTHGETDIPGLYAIGEVTFTGLHGANRLASNSLLEAAVYAGKAARHASETLLQRQAIKRDRIPEWDSGTATNSDEMVVITQNWDEIRRFMWNYVGIVRSTKRLERAMRRIKLIQEEIHDFYWNFTITSDLIELRNIATVAKLIVTCAQMRKESRGLHYTIDYPELDDLNWQRDTIVKKQFA